jgi:hypothetical protein
MISYNDLFVSSIALIGSAAALAVGFGPWRKPYRLRSIAIIVDRFGMAAARGVWIAVALVSLIAAISIASGVRPGYAKPSQGSVDSAR